MKRLLIGGLIIVVLGIGAGIFSYKKTMNSNISLKSTSNKEVSKGVNATTANSKNVVNNTTLSNNNKSQDEHSLNTSNSLSSSNKLENSNGSEGKNGSNNGTEKINSINWNLINSTGVLSQENVDFLIKGIDNALYPEGVTHDVEFKSTRDMINYVNDTIIPMIRAKLSGENLTKFNETVENFENFNQSSTKFFVDGRKATVSNDKIVYEIDIRAAYQNFAAYLISSYTNYGYNPTLTNSVKRIYELDGQGIVPSNLMNNFCNAKSQAEEVLSNMNSNNYNSVNNSYNNIYNILNNSLNENYGYIKENIDNIVGPTLLTNYEEQWISFKNRQIEIAGQGLTGVNKEVAQQRETIRLTELRNYNLLYNFSYDLTY